MPLLEDHHVKHQNQLFDLLRDHGSTSLIPDFKRKQKFGNCFLDIFICYRFMLILKCRVMGAISTGEQAIIYLQTIIIVLVDLEFTGFCKKWKCLETSVLLQSEHLKWLYVCTAAGRAGPGWAWLTLDTQQNCWRAVCTVNSSLLCFSMFSHDVNTNRDVTCYP